MTHASMKRIDSHQHFWEYDPAQYPWIQPDWPIRRSFLPHDLAPLLKASDFDGCVAVQARQSLEETRWLLQLAEANPFIAGVVGWVDLRAPDVADQLKEVSHPRLAGVRHVVQDEPDDRFLVRPDFVRGISVLGEFDLAYDLLIYPRQLPAAIELVRQFPEQRFVLDHIAKPPIRDGVIEPWRKRIQELAAMPNVHCKLSGMVTEARWREWRASEFHPYLEAVWDAFGEERLMAGSDWPVCLNSAGYDEAIGIVREFVGKRTDHSGVDAVFGGNAIRFYQLRAR